MAQRTDELHVLKEHIVATSRTEIQPAGPTRGSDEESPPGTAANNGSPCSAASASGGFFPLPSGQASIGAENHGDDDLGNDPLSIPHWDPQLRDDGRVEVRVDLRRFPTLPSKLPPDNLEEPGVGPTGTEHVPSLSIVIFIVGSRGDVQPYLALALKLVESHGHRVRIATHSDFKSLVEEANDRLKDRLDLLGQPLEGKLEHFNIGGNPHQLMAYMVKNPGLIPGLSSVASGDLTTKREMVRTMLLGCYDATLRPNETTGSPFVADVIISNPPAFAHIHVAEALGIPLIMSFTMPWSPTASFRHPLIKPKTSHPDIGMNNLAGFVVANSLMWQGLGDLINAFRAEVLGLRPLPIASGPLVLERLKIPWTYAWSPALLPKPKDWRSNIDVVGFYTMSDDSRYHPDPDLVSFLEAGDPPLYIGFGSVVIDDPERLTDILLTAIKRTGTRAIISTGWADLGSSSTELPNTVKIIKDVPHGWLFAKDRIAAVCHHGGAGTTCAGLRAGLPTIVIPFFGDQWFWGQAVYEAGAGPLPIPHAKLTKDNLTTAIAHALSEPVRKSAAKVGERICSEDGLQKGVDSMHRHLPLTNMRCEVDPSRAALWWDSLRYIRLSGVAAAVLVEEQVTSWDRFCPHRPVNYDSTRHYHSPLMAIGQAILNIGSEAVTGTGKLFYAPQRGLPTLVFGVPKAALDVVGSFQEGLNNIPGMLGSPVRPQGQINSLQSGITEGTKGLVYGIFDGVTGLVKEPYKGAMESGVDGFVDGAFRGLANLAARPAAGALGLVVHPAAGAFRDMRARLRPLGLGSENQAKLPDPLFEARKKASRDMARGLSKEERQTIVSLWHKLGDPDAIDRRREAAEQRRQDAEAYLLHQPQSEALEFVEQRLSTAGDGDSPKPAQATVQDSERI